MSYRTYLYIAQHCTSITTLTTYLLDVELLLCVAEWINQSKQTTGRRETPKTSLTITYYVKYNKHFWRRQLGTTTPVFIQNPPYPYRAFLGVLNCCCCYSTHWFQSRNVRVLGPFYLDSVLSMLSMIYDMKREGFFEHKCSYCDRLWSTYELLTTMSQKMVIRMLGNFKSESEVAKKLWIYSERFAVFIHF